MYVYTSLYYLHCYICIYIYVCLYIQCIYTNMYIYVYLSIHTHILTHLYIHEHTHPHPPTHIYFQTHVCIHTNHTPTFVFFESRAIHQKTTTGMGVRFPALWARIRLSSGDPLGVKGNGSYQVEQLFTSQLNTRLFDYGVATVSRIDKIEGLFCRISSVL